MTVCDRCGKPINDMFESPPTCNRCEVLELVKDTIAANTCRSCEPDDIATTAEAVLQVFDNPDENNISLLGEWLIQIGWR